MAENLRHWSALEKTDPSATKPFERAGGFRGTATKPIYHEKRMTQHFGPCGIGWGMGKPEFQLVPAENEMLVYCTVALWYMDGETRGEVYGVGGDKVVAQQKRGPFVSDEAFKAAFTDALGNAMKHIGVGADIHMGEFDKYGRDRDDAPPASARSPSPPRSPPQLRTAPQTPTSAPVPPPNPEEPPEVAAARKAARAHFWTRDNYGIDPAVIPGGIGAWDAEFLAQAEAAHNLDQFIKLKQDCAEAGYTTTWAAAVQPAVKEHFVRRRAAIERRLGEPQGEAAA